MKQRIIAIDKGSIAEELSIEKNSCLLAVDGEEVLDVIDYEALTASAKLVLTIESPDGEIYEAEICKDEYEPLGLNFESGLMSKPRACKNRCLFCFIDQMPKGGRETLHFKDDDWRLSLIMGNYVTLTNVDDAEFARMLKRRVSPLYISVHSTDGELRKKIMSNPTASRIMERLRALKDNGLRFNSQIVLCPGINDGDALRKSILDLYALRPYSETVAVIPVGLTKHREGLYPLRVLTKDEANAAIDMIEEFQKKFLKESESRFVFASDEMYIIAERELPPEESYEDYAQLENGVGLLRKFEFEFLDELSYQKPLKKKKSYAAVCGTAAYGFLNELYKKLLPYNIEVELTPVVNNFFGSTVTVSGLLCACDIIAAMQGRINGRPLLIATSMLRERDDVFLDGVRLPELSRTLNTDIIALPAVDGADCVRELFAIKD